MGTAATTTPSLAWASPQAQRSLPQQTPASCLAPDDAATTSSTMYATAMPSARCTKTVSVQQSCACRPRTAGHPLAFVWRLAARLAPSRPAGPQSPGQTDAPLADIADDGLRLRRLPGILRLGTGQPRLDYSRRIVNDDRPANNHDRGSHDHDCSGCDRDLRAGRCYVRQQAWSVQQLALLSC